MKGASIQLAIDSLGEHSGGCVKLSPGTFTICCPIKMKNGVKLIGSEKTILQKCDSCTLRLARDGDVSEREILVDGLSNGELNFGVGVKIYDDLRFFYFLFFYFYLFFCIKFLFFFDNFDHYFFLISK